MADGVLDKVMSKGYVADNLYIAYTLTMLIKQNKDLKLPKITSSSAFTIVELLIVIVIIGILAAITVVSYTGITGKANQATLQSDLANNTKKLSMYYAQYGEYPHINSSSGCPENPSTPDSNYCLKFSSGNTFVYTYKSTTTYGLSATRGSVTYNVTESTSPQIAASITCPTGFIVVPGSPTYSTSDFCVMKYEAKNAGSNIPVSTATGAPWVSISQTNAIAYAPNVAGCTGCHLITEAEWMTLAKNVLSVPENWSGGVVGSGYIFSGHNDNTPASALVADTSDANGYSGTGQSSGNQKRTLALTNGEVIWDMAGNVWEWTSGQTANGSANQPGVAGNAYASWLEWPNVTIPGSLTVNVAPAGTSLASAGSWTSTNGIGQLVSNPADTVLRGFIRGGAWYDGGHAGVLSLNLNIFPNTTGTDSGFRVSR